jgi:hypothetical protein
MPNVKVKEAVVVKIKRKAAVISLLLITSFLLVSCEDRQAVEINRLHDTIMLMHDQAMLKMSDMMKLKRKLADKKNIASNDTLVQKYDQAIDELESADKYMMQWMRGYKKPEPTAEGISYLENQYESVQVVSQKIDSAITKGQYILQY